MSVVEETATTLETVATIAATAVGLNQIARHKSLRNRVFWAGIGVGVGVGLIVGTALTASLGDATVAVARRVLRKLLHNNEDRFNREYLV